MFNKTINWMKGVMVKLGLVQKIKDVSDIKKIPVVYIVKTVMERLIIVIMK
ncbi:UNVERIFIED_CONTAM: hypothetical protein BJ099_118102 [Lysinibacillus xylanilyticus]